MTSENVRERKEKRRYTFVVVPDVKSEKTRTFSITRLGFVGMILSAFIVLVALILAVVIYTPLGSHLPISNPELTRYYGMQIIEIQKQMQHFIREITVLRNYNLRLRKVMGEQISPQDSILMLTGGIDTSLAAKFRIDEADTGFIAPMEEEEAVPIQHPVQSSLIPVQDQKQEGLDVSMNLPLVMPVSGFVTREFDAEQFHYGIDLAGKQGSPVFASADGTVIFANWTYEDGFMIMITHEYGILTVYKHNYSLLKNVGDTVKRGEIIALLGNTGERSSGPHLHFEVWKNGVVQNPNNYLLSIN